MTMAIPNVEICMVFGFSQYASQNSLLRAVHVRLRGLLDLVIIVEPCSCCDRETQAALVKDMGLE